MKNENTDTIDEVHKDLKENQEEKTPEREVITGITSITRAIEINPFATEIFQDVGLGCSGCFMAEVETIQQGLLAHGFNQEGIDMVIEELNSNDN